MQKNFTLETCAVALLMLMAQNANAQDDLIVDHDLYRYYTETTTVLPSYKASTRAGEERPDHVDNSKTKFFPPVFNQTGGSCGAASSISYAFTYEMNCLRDLDGSLPANQYPSHWVYLLAYQVSNDETILQKNGVPSVEDYGGRTISAIFGDQDVFDDYTGRMQGYDKWYRAMHNRVLRRASFKADLTTEEGREDLKYWLWNHHGDEDFHGGGMANVGVAMTGYKAGTTPFTKNNKANGLLNKKYITTWGPGFDHSVTIVGYDDRIEFDLDNDGKIGEEGEVGAWIICNSWGDGWENGGCVYCPYKYSYSVNRYDMPMTPGCWIVRKDYTPKRVFRIEMEYSHRGELQLSAGISEREGASVPSNTTAISMFNYDGNPNNLTPAPEVPMLGKWADGKMHTEPMEFGFDVTDLTAEADDANNLTYFLQIRTKEGAVGSGKVHRLSLIDYESGEVVTEALEYGKETVDIKSNGGVTYVSLVVPGRETWRPLSPSVSTAKSTFSWKAPTKASKHTLVGYVVYQNSIAQDTLAADELSYVIDKSNQGYVQVSALYEDENKKLLESKRTDVLSPVMTRSTVSAKLSCDLDGLYIGYIRKLMSGGGSLTSLDLSEATIINSDYTYSGTHATKLNTMGTDMFKDCKKMQSFKIPNNIETIETDAFYGCSSLSSIVIPDAVIYISGSFGYCNALREVTIGSGVKSMGSGAFWQSGVQNVYAKPMTPPVLGDAYVFSSNPVIHVYSDALADYQASAWAGYGTIVGDLENFIPKEETSISDVKSDDSDSDVYTLDGVKQKGEGRNGIYIKNGKKYLKK